MHYLKFGQDALYISRHNHRKQQTLEITYQDCAIRTNMHESVSEGTSFNCLIGVKFIKNHPILFIGVQSEQLFMLGLSKIFEIKKISYVAIAPEKDQAEILGKLTKELQQIQFMFEAGFHYYSDQYDLSLPFVQNKFENVGVFERQYYDQFVWNHNLATLDGQRSQTQRGLFYSWCDRIVQGHIKEFACPVPEGHIKYVLISRRSHRKAGTRFYARGIDDDGAVANFVESEQIITLGQYIFSHLQIRGSVPIFFAQVGVNGLQEGMTIERSKHLTKNAFYRHYGTLSQIYRRILSVNLLSNKKKEEAKLTQFFEQMTEEEESKTPYLRYQYYDFHEQCKNNKFEKSEALIDKLSDVIAGFGFNCYQIKSNKLVQHQRGVFRTNCLDCLDRTNYVQSRIALKVCKFFIAKYGHQKVHTLCTEKQLLDFPVNEEYPLARGFNELWADNGDGISLLYTGIGSTHTDITRTGTRTFVGAFNHKFRSLSRFFTQFSDHLKHEAIMNIVTPTILRSSAQKMGNFYTTLVLSIDCHQALEFAMQKLNEYLSKSKPSIILVYIFRKKEVDFLSIISCYMNQTTDFKIWQDAICRELQLQSYIQVGSLMADRCWMGVYCLEKESKNVADIRQENLSKQIRHGEVLLLKMKIQHSTFIFAGVNCQNYDQFLTIFDELHEKGFQINKLGLYRSSSIFELDYKIIVGNTGSEIMLPEKDLRQMKIKFEQEIQKGNVKESDKIIHKILDHDQFSQEQNLYKNKYLRQYNQGPVHFIPSSNRMVFWNQQNVVLRVRQYQDIGQGSIAGLLDYQICHKEDRNSFRPE